MRRIRLKSMREGEDDEGEDKEEEEGEDDEGEEDKEDGDEDDEDDEEDEKDEEKKRKKKNDVKTEKVVMREVVHVFSANLLFHLCSPPALKPGPAKRHFTSHPHTHGA